MASLCRVRSDSTSFCKAGNAGKSSGASALVFIVLVRMSIKRWSNRLYFKRSNFASVADDDRVHCACKDLAIEIQYCYLLAKLSHYVVNYAASTKKQPQEPVRLG